MTAADPFDLRRFLDAQATSYDDAIAELRAGRKRTHWMWYVFPQIAGLGHSPIAKRYAISSLDEAKAYLANPILGQRLQECTTAMLAVEGKSAFEILSSPDDMKFRSSMTLFGRAAQGHSEFKRTLAKYFGGNEDSATLQLLGVK